MIADHRALNVFAVKTPDSSTYSALETMMYLLYDGYIIGIIDA
jgi:hypothetical protein